MKRLNKQKGKMNMQYEAIRSEEISDKKKEERYVIVDMNGKILDDCDGNGYKTSENAYRAYVYKTKNKNYANSSTMKKQTINEWCETNSDFCKELDIILNIIKNADINEKDGGIFMDTLFRLSGKALPVSAHIFWKYYDRHLPF